VGQAVPNFWMGIMLIFVFGVILGWLPTGGRQTVSLTQEFDLADRIRHIILPATVLALGGIAIFSRVMRTETLEVINTDYIRTARAKGATERSVLFVHALRNAILPVITLAGLQLGQILSGAVLVEAVFDWPGLGRLAFDSILRRDYPTILGILFASSVMVVVINLATDLVYRLVDPRIRAAGGH